MWVTLAGSQDLPGMPDLVSCEDLEAILVTIQVVRRLQCPACLGAVSRGRQLEALICIELTGMSLMAVLLRAGTGLF